MQRYLEVRHMPRTHARHRYSPARFFCTGKIGPLLRDLHVRKHEIGWNGEIGQFVPDLIHFVAWLELESLVKLLAVQR
jgi:hypothetical protein